MQPAKQFYSNDICICMLSSLFLSAFRTYVSYVGLFLFYPICHVPPPPHSHYYNHHDAKYLKRNTNFEAPSCSALCSITTVTTSAMTVISELIYLKVQFDNLNLCKRKYKIKITTGSWDITQCNAVAIYFRLEAP
jgi:hypothetical protein